MADLRGYVEGLIGFEGDGTNVVANPTGTPTDDLESIQIGETIYSVGGGGEEIVPTPTTVDRGKYLGVKSNANELEYRSINELPSSEGSNAGDVLTHTISGDSWLPPAKELPTYTTGDNGKVLGISSGTPAWLEQSGGGGSFIDTTNIIIPFVAINDTQEHTYTATGDCAISYTLATNSNTDSYIKVNNILVGGMYSTSVMAQNGLIFLKAGQTFTFKQTFTKSSITGYTVFGII